MKLDKQYLIEKASLVASFVKRFRFVIAFAIFSIMYGYILLQVNTIESKQPDEKKVSEQAAASPQTKISPALAEKITSLEDQNVQIKTLFNTARKNPFAE